MLSSCNSAIFTRHASANDIGTLEYLSMRERMDLMCDETWKSTSRTPLSRSPRTAEVPPGVSWSRKHVSASTASHVSIGGFISLSLSRAQKWKLSFLFIQATSGPVSTSICFLMSRIPSCGSCCGRDPQARQHIRSDRMPL